MDPVEIAKQLGSPFFYAVITYLFFRYLDGQASEEAKRALSGWLRPREYDRAAVAAAVVELFDRLYSQPLWGWRAIVRSTFLTLIITAIFVFEFVKLGPIYMVVEVFKNELNLYPTEFAVVYLLANIISDYVSLFIVRSFLVVSKKRPALGLIGGPLLGMLVVILFTFGRDIAAYFHDPIFRFAPIMFKVRSAWIFLPHNLRTMWPALIVHLWLPFLGLGLLFLSGLNYFFRVVGVMQWFLKRGDERPVEAVGYVLGALVLVGTAAARLV